MEESRLGDVCPACGAPKSVFEPYTDPLSERRRKVLDAHIHPIAVHFPTAFAAVLLVLIIASLIFSGNVKHLITDTAKILALLLPFVVIPAFLTGILDGKTRFRRIDKSQVLKKKIVYGTVFFLSAAGLAVVLLVANMETAGSIIGALLLSAVGVGASVVLGLLGMGLINSAFPGK